MNNAKKLSMQAMEKTKGGKFIGWSDWGNCGPSVPNPAGHGCGAVCYRYYDFFWIQVDSENQWFEMPCE